MEPVDQNRWSAGSSETTRLAWAISNPEFVYTKESLRAARRYLHAYYGKLPVPIYGSKYFSTAEVLELGTQKD
jgi:hypothetical protein